MIKDIGSLKFKQKELENIPIIYLFFKIAMDMVGSLPKIALGNEYVLLAINQYFKWCCRNPSLGFATKARGGKVMGQEGSPRVMPHALKSARKSEGIDPHTPKGTPTLGVKTPVDFRMF
jgi:hypothetical protein